MSEFNELFDGFKGAYEAVHFEDYPEIKVGVAVRPLLRFDDLELLRRVFVVYSKEHVRSPDSWKARELLKRMLRKVK